MCIGSSVAISCADAVGGRCRVILGGLAASGLMLGATGLVIAAGVAKADGSRSDHSAYAYAAELRADGMSGTADSAENLAAQVCLARTNGHTEQEAISYAETMPMPSKMATDVVMGAEWHFCPQYATFSNRLDQILGPVLKVG
jgi:hypothetical protein